MWSREEIEKVAEACETLDVSVDADVEEIHKAYKNGARLFHPDKNKDPSAKSQFIKIKDAHDLLLNKYIREKLKNSRSGITLFHAKKILQSDWEFDDFSRATDTFALKGVAGGFEKDTVTFYHYASNKPQIHLTFKGDSDFCKQMYQKLNQVLIYDTWHSFPNYLGGTLQFILPRDEIHYPQALAIIFKEYKLPAHYFDLIIQKKPKEDFISPQVKFGYNY